MELWIKHNTRRTAIRENRPEAASWAQRITEKKAWRSLGVAAAFWLLLAGILLMRQEVVRHRPGQYVAHNTTARVAFSYFDQDELTRQREAARLGAPRVYRQAAGNVWDSLRGKLLTLPDRVYGLTKDQLDQPWKDLLNNGDISDLNQVHTGPQRQRYADDVKQFVNNAQAKLTIEGRPLVILPYDDWMKDRGRRILLGHSAEPVDALQDTYSTHLPESVSVRLSDCARGFEHSSSECLARIAAAELAANPNYVLDESLTTQMQRRASEDVPNENAERHFAADEVIVPKGVITDRHYQILRAENDAYTRSLATGWAGIWQQRLGLIGVALMVTLLLTGYVARYQPRIVKNYARAGALAGLLLSMLLVTQLSAIGSSSLLIFGVGPTILVTIILTIAYDQRFAMGLATIDAMVVTGAIDQDLGFFFILWVGLLTASYLLDEVRTRSKLIEVGGITAVTMMLVCAAVGAVRMQPLQYIGGDCLYVGAAGLGAGFVALGILPFIEKIFRITTSITLLELADVSHPLLRRLAIEAPGTYNHSLQVATLAEAAAEAIGVDMLACRVGSYYHDIGKVNKPDYFIENQMVGEPNRHLNLTPNVSLLVIIGHVKDGVEMAKEYNLPSSLVPYIQQHHGTTLVEYFYNQARKNAGPDQPGIDDTQFRYPGPKPKTRESAVVMLCDAVESACRSMVEPTANRVESLVHEIMMSRLLDGQFADCELTMRDLEKIEKALNKALLGIYHGRIAYESTASITSRPVVIRSA